MCDANGYRVVFVIMLYDLVDLEEEVEHAGDLFLVGPTGAGCGAFYLAGGVFKGGDAGDSGGVQDGSPHLGDLHDGLLVVIEEEPLHGEGIRLVFSHEVLALSYYLRQALDESFGGFRLDAVRIYPNLFPVSFLDDGDATAAVSRIYGDDTHIGPV